MLSASANEESQLKMLSPKFLGKINWSQFENYVLSRVHKLEEIRECPIIYTGAAPTSPQETSIYCGWNLHTKIYGLNDVLIGE